MMKVYQIKESKRQEIPAVTHVDGSGRLQTVYKDTNEKYYNLIHEFYKLTNIPILFFFFVIIIILIKKYNTRMRNV